MISGNAEVAQVLCEKWAPTVDFVQVNRAVGDAFLQRWGRRTDVVGVPPPPPTASLYASVIARARHSAPGPDGLPAAAWQAVLEVSASVIQCIGDEVRSG